MPGYNLTNRQEYTNVRERRIQIFENTKQLCETDPELVKRIEWSKGGQFFIDSRMPVSRDTGNHDETRSTGTPARVIVSGKRTLEAASAYRGKTVCVLNFASATNPGGGVTKGSSAQEEAICRCSTLYPLLAGTAMKAAFHDTHRSQLKSGKLTALYNNDCIYTPGVTVFKSDTDFPQLLPREEWFQVDVISCAAPNLKNRPSNAMNPDSGEKPVAISRENLKRLLAERAERILAVAARNRVQVLILGAFGCGAFCNPPAVVAEAFKDALKEYIYDFETIEFAVFCPPGKAENYNAFRRVFRERKNS